MTAQLTYCDQVAWKPLSSKESGGKIAGKKEGFHLPNSVTEDVGGFSLTPAYSARQLKCIGKKKGRRGISRKARNQWRMVSKW